MATNGLRIRVQGDILYKSHPVDIAEQKKSFILLDCVIYKWYKLYFKSETKFKWIKYTILTL